ncbi:MAG: ATP-binding protein [Candidatus Methanoperedens sp.]|nr:ATP-binding protein [Candidatus Methanoperedens sp.]
MFLKFINRKDELQFLEERYSRHGFDFIVIYGRRRIGKTELIKNFAKNKPRIYMLCNKAGTTANIKRFRQETSKSLKEPEIATENLEEIFSYLVQKTKEKHVVVLDEFSYLVEKDDSIPSVFQGVIDEVLKDKNIMLIICGSSTSMMESLLGYKNPLYGRKTGHMKIDFLKFRHLKEFFPRYTFEENMRAYAILGGVPFYLEKFDTKKTALENAKEQILSKKGQLYEEVDFLLREELREPDVYKSILAAIAQGGAKVAEIASKAGIKASDMDRYLKVLTMLGIIRKEIPVTETKSKKTLYTIDDNFFHFYSMFFEPYRSDIEIGDTANLDKNLKKNFNSFVGKKFEKLMRTEAVRAISPFPASRIGRWWGYYRENEKRKDLEIDIIALNEETREILFCECKWQDRVNAEKIFEDLKEKTNFVNWNNEKRKEHYAIVAKSFSKRTEHALCIDLKNLEKIL